MDRDPDSLRVSTWPRRTSVENSSPSRTTHSAAVAPPFMARRTMSWARERRSVSSFGFLVSDCAEDISRFFTTEAQSHRKEKRELENLEFLWVSVPLW